MCVCVYGVGWGEVGCDRVRRKKPTHFWDLQEWLISIFIFLQISVASFFSSSGTCFVLFLVSWNIILIFFVNIRQFRGRAELKMEALQF